MKHSLLTILLALTVGAIYGPLAQYGYVHDDRVAIRSFETTGMPDLSPIGKTFFRPLGSLYCYAVYSIFGNNAAGFHILAMLLLFGTALIVRLVALALTNDDGVGWGSAFLYAAAAHVHLDAQMWLVGVLDNGAALFALLCLHAYLRGWIFLSALWLACALGFKESAAPMVAVTAVAALIIRTGGKDVLRVWPLFAVAGLWGILKSLGASATGLPQDDPYAWSLAGWHLAENIGVYAIWFAPAPLATIAVVILAGWACFMKPRTGWFLVLWALLMLLPPAILLHHAFRYYAIPALPAIAIGVTTGIFAFPVSGRWKHTIAVVFVLANILVGLLFIQGHVRRGIHDDLPAKDDGYNHLIRRSLRGE